MVFLQEMIKNIEVYLLIQILEKGRGYLNSTIRQSLIGLINGR